MTASSVDKRGFAAAGDFTVLQQLHDAEISGRVTWWKPLEAFTVTIVGDEAEHFPNWVAAEARFFEHLVESS